MKKLSSEQGETLLSLSGKDKIASSFPETLVRRILKLRSTRHRIFGSSLFGEPAWDILLALYLNKLSGRAEPVSGLCVVPGVPSSTALRWINHLEHEGWIHRKPDEGDEQRSLIELTLKAEDALQALFAEDPVASDPV